MQTVEVGFRYRRKRDSQMFVVIEIIPGARWCVVLQNEQTERCHRVERLGLENKYTNIAE